MTERKTDEAIRQKASRLRLTFVRDHVAEVLDIADKTKMTPREVICNAPVRVATYSEQE